MTREEIVKSMSVQDAIQVLLDTNTYGTADIAKTVAIDTMRKYQKIEQIIKDHDNDRIPEDYWYIDKNIEVIEDGKEEEL